MSAFRSMQNRSAMLDEGEGEDEDLLNQTFEQYGVRGSGLGRERGRGPKRSNLVSQLSLTQQQQQHAKSQKNPMMQSFVSSNSMDVTTSEGKEEMEIPALEPLSSSQSNAPLQTLTRPSRFGPPLQTMQDQPTSQSNAPPQPRARPTRFGPPLQTEEQPFSDILPPSAASLQAQVNNAEQRFNQQQAKLNAVLASKDIDLKVARQQYTEDQDTIMDLRADLERAKELLGDAKRAYDEKQVSLDMTEKAYKELLDKAREFEQHAQSTVQSTNTQSQVLDQSLQVANRNVTLLTDQLSSERQSVARLQSQLAGARDDHARKQRDADKALAEAREREQKNTNEIKRLDEQTQQLAASGTRLQEDIKALGQKHRDELQNATRTWERAKNLLDSQVAERDLTIGMERTRYGGDLQQKQNRITELEGQVQSARNQAQTAATELHQTKTLLQDTKNELFAMTRKADNLQTAVDNKGVENVFNTASARQEGLTAGGLAGVEHVQDILGKMAECFVKNGYDEKNVLECMAKYHGKDHDIADIVLGIVRGTAAAENRRTKEITENAIEKMRQEAQLAIAAAEEKKGPPIGSDEPMLGIASLPGSQNPRGPDDDENLRCGLLRKAAKKQEMDMPKIWGMCADRCWGDVVAKYMGEQYNMLYPLAEQVAHIRALRQDYKELAEVLDVCIATWEKTQKYLHAREELKLDGDQATVLAWVVQRYQDTRTTIEERTRGGQFDFAALFQGRGPVVLNPDRLRKANAQFDKDIKANPSGFFFKEIWEVPERAMHWRYNAADARELLLSMASLLDGQK